MTLDNTWCCWCLFQISCWSLKGLHCPSDQAKRNTRSNTNTSVIKADGHIWASYSDLFKLVNVQLHSTCTSQLRLIHLVVQKDGLWHTACHQPRAGGFWWKWGKWKEEMNFNIVQCNKYKSMLMLKSLLSHLLYPDKTVYKDKPHVYLYYRPYLDPFIRLNYTGFSGYHEKVPKKVASRFLLLYLWKSLPLLSSHIYILLNYRERLSCIMTRCSVQWTATACDCSGMY